MDYVWELIAPYVAGILGTAGGGTIIYILVRLFMGKVFKRNSAMLTSTFNTDQIAQNVAEKLAGKTVNIDVTAVTEKALKKTSKQLDERVEKVENATKALKDILVAIAKGIIKLKALSDEEKEELASAIKTLEKGYVPPEEDQPMTVLLQPVVLPEDTEEEESAGVNFNGLEG